LHEPTGRQSYFLLTYNVFPFVLYNKMAGCISCCTSLACHLPRTFNGKWLAPLYFTRLLNHPHSFHCTFFTPCSSIKSCPILMTNSPNKSEKATLLGNLIVSQNVVRYIPNSFPRDKVKKTP